MKTVIYFGLILSTSLILAMHDNEMVDMKLDRQEKENPIVVTANDPQVESQVESQKKDSPQPAKSLVQVVSSATSTHQTWQKNGSEASWFSSLSSKSEDEEFNDLLASLAQESEETETKEIEPAHSPSWLARFTFGYLGK